MRGNKTSQDMAKVLHDVMTVAKHLAPGREEQIYRAEDQILNDDLATQSQKVIRRKGLPTVHTYKSEWSC